MPMRGLSSSPRLRLGFSGANWRKIVPVRTNDNDSHGGESIQNYLHIGGAKDGQLFPVADGAGAAAGFDLYILDSLSVSNSRFDLACLLWRHQLAEKWGQKKLKMSLSPDVGTHLQNQFLAAEYEWKQKRQKGQKKQNFRLFLPFLSFLPFLLPPYHSL